MSLKPVSSRVGARDRRRSSGPHGPERGAARANPSPGRDRPSPSRPSSARTRCAGRCSSPPSTRRWAACWCSATAAPASRRRSGASPPCCRRWRRWSAAPMPAIPAGPAEQCHALPRAAGAAQAASVPVPVVDLPLGATEDRVVGALDLERALTRGEKAFEPGLLARANRGFLYIDEVNLLEDHLVDLLLDVAASRREHRRARGPEHPPSRPASCSWAAATRRRASCGPSSSTASASPSR